MYFRVNIKQKSNLKNILKLILCLLAIMNPKSPEARNRDDKPFEGLQISNSCVLNELTTRSPCSRCGKSRMYFCYTCFVPVAQLEGLIPLCTLPVKVDIIKHRREIDGKSTAAHAAVLAPGDVNVYTYPDIPEYVNDGRTVLLYPGTEARTVRELFTGRHDCLNYAENRLADLPPGYNVGTLMTKMYHNNSGNNEEIYHVKKLPIDRLLLIDSTWNQSRGIFCDERLQKIPKIVLQKRISQFWRHQKGSPRWYLSTIEALHQVLLEMHICAWGRSEQYNTELTSDCPIHSQENHTCEPYNGQYDNLLYFFKYMYEKLHSLYKHEDLLAYQRPMEI